MEIQMSELTAQKIIDIHNDIIERLGGTRGILNQGTIDHLIYRFGRENDAFKKAAIALDQIITGHPFFDGNKRTAFEVADMILRKQGDRIHASEDEKLGALLKIARYRCNVRQIENWLRNNSSKLRQSF